MCKMRIVYEYDDDDKITREFGTKQGKPMLINPNLMLQYIDQRKLCNGNTQKSLIVKINTDIKYQCRFHNGNKSDIRIWRHTLSDFEVQIESKFNWKINKSTTLAINTINVSSLWITNLCAINQDPHDDTNQEFEDDEFRCLCQENVRIDKGCSININKKMVIFCDTFTMMGRLHTPKRILVVTNKTNLEPKSHEITFGFIQKALNSDNIEDFKLKYSTSFYHTQQVQSYSYQLLEKMPLIKFADPHSKTMYLKSKLFSLISEQKYVDTTDNVFLYLSSFLDKHIDEKWIRNSLKPIIEDKQFVQQINLFLPQKCLTPPVYEEEKSSLPPMSLFEFMFFECKFYQIANYVKESGYYHDDVDIFKIIIGTDFFSVDNNWIQSIDQKQKLFTRYPPTKCKVVVIYDYDDQYKIHETFQEEKALEMLFDTNLILQYIDQRKLYKLKHKYFSSHASQQWKGLTICISINIQYGDTAECSWKHNLQDFKIEIGNELNWKINHDSTFTVDTLYISSLWVTNNSKIDSIASKLNDDDGNHGIYDNEYDMINSVGGQFKIVCQQNIIIDKHCSICMNQKGIKGAIYFKQQKVGEKKGVKVTEAVSTTAVEKIVNIVTIT
eukprot:250982_1